MTPLRPAGRVLFGEHVIDAVAEFGFIEAGATVRVISADGFRTAVEPMTGDDSPGSTGSGGTIT
jgi:membrane-bound ClpP family serine protease